MSTLGDGIMAMWDHVFGPIAKGVSWLQDFFSMNDANASGNPELPAQTREERLEQARTRKAGELAPAASRTAVTPLSTEAYQDGMPAVQTTLQKQAGAGQPGTGLPGTGMPGTGAPGTGLSPTGLPGAAPGLAGQPSGVNVNLAFTLHGMPDAAFAQGVITALRERASDVEALISGIVNNQARLAYGR